MATTTNYGWTKPTVGGDNGTWGTIANALFDAVDAALKVVADATAAVQAELTSLKGAQVGMVGHFLVSSAPSGWIKGDGGTIGNASSGGTTRANADTAALFALYWACDATTFPVYDSGGGGSTRGANAAADYAANKRILIEDLRAEFIRGLDDSRGVDAARVLGSAQTDEFEAHTHTTPNIQTNMNSTGGTNTGGFTGSGTTTGSTGSTETRPRNIARLACIKL